MRISTSGRRIAARGRGCVAPQTPAVQPLLLLKANYLVANRIVLAALLAGITAARCAGTAGGPGPTAVCGAILQKVRAIFAPRNRGDDAARLRIDRVATAIEPVWCKQGLLGSESRHIHCTSSLLTKRSDATRVTTRQQGVSGHRVSCAPTRTDRFGAISRIVSCSRIDDPPSLGTHAKPLKPLSTQALFLGTSEFPNRRYSNCRGRPSSDRSRLTLRYRARHR